MLPRWLYRVLARSGRRNSERRRRCRFPDVERAVARLAPRPWLMIHGQRDTYISPEIVQELFRSGNGPREMWLVPDAKHNRCREREPEAYAGRLLDFIDRYAPRRPITEPPAPARPLASAAADMELPGGFVGEIEAPKLTGEVATPLRVAIGSGPDREHHALPGSSRMINTSLMRLLGAPVEIRARRLSRAFLAQTGRAADVQRDLLLERIARHADSQFGRDHHFGEIRTPADFRRRVPIGDYARHEPYIDRVRQGDLNALFGPGTEVLMFAMTSGTTNRPKTIPVTRESLHDYREGWTIWGILAFDAHIEILRRGLRPILQLASDWRESATPAGIPCGAITGLTAHMQNPLVRTTYCMPAAASRIKDIESKYYTALRFSCYRNVGTVIAANPSTILAMARLGDREKSVLIRDLSDGTIDARWDIPPMSAAPCGSGRRSATAARRVDSSASSIAPAACCPRTTGPTWTSCPTGWAAR